MLVAGSMVLPGGAMPSASAAIAIVLAVNWPAQAPIEGSAQRSMTASSAFSTVPASTPPTAS